MSLASRLVIGCAILCSCGGEHSIPRQAPGNQQQPVDTIELQGLDSLSREVARMMRTYFHTIDSSMRADPVNADSLGLPADGFMQINARDSAAAEGER